MPERIGGVGFFVFLAGVLFLLLFFAELRPSTKRVEGWLAGFARDLGLVVEAAGAVDLEWDVGGERLGVRRRESRSVSVGESARAPRWPQPGL